MTTATYRIVRMFQNRPSVRLTGREFRGLTLDQAQAHCRDPETSSRTVTPGKNPHPMAAHWFDGYEEE